MTSFLLSNKNTSVLNKLCSRTKSQKVKLHLVWLEESNITILAQT